jgi:hypothetical protein
MHCGRRTGCRDDWAYCGIAVHARSPVGDGRPCRARRTHAERRPHRGALLEAVPARVEGRPAARRRREGGRRRDRARGAGCTRSSATGLEFVLAADDPDRDTGQAPDLTPWRTGTGPERFGVPRGEVGMRRQGSRDCRSRYPRDDPAHRHRSPPHGVRPYLDRQQPAPHRSPAGGGGARVVDEPARSDGVAEALRRVLDWSRWVPLPWVPDIVVSPQPPVTPRASWGLAVGRHHHPVNRALVGSGPADSPPAGSARTGVRPPRPGAGSVGTAFEGPGEARITLRGDLDAAALGRLEADLEGCLTFHIRFITVDATAVSGASNQIVELLGDTRRELTSRRGILSVLGLHPHVLRADPDEPTPAASPAAAGTPTLR